MIILILSFIGFLLSAYAYFVELNITKNKKYKPLCDIKNNISCSKAFSSKYGKLIGISNSLIGIFFYLFLMILYFINLKIIIFYLSIFSFIGTIFLAYILFLKLKNFCLVCILIYIINALILIFSIIETGPGWI